MVKLQSKELEQSVEVHRIIGHIKGTSPGPTVIFVGGIHGNEPAGVFALHKVITQLQESNTPVRGSIYAIAGNLKALKNGERFQEEDLNRLWSANEVKKLQNGALLNPKNQDREEQVALYKSFKEILGTETGPFYFFDLHTTSSKTIPFITVNDNLLNRKFTKQYPVPIVLGIEEYLDGPLLSYVNELGYVAFGFEGGQHNDLSSIDNHLAFINLSLVFTDSVKKDSIDFNHYNNILIKNSLEVQGFYEIFNHFILSRKDEFLMKPGFINFQRIKKGQELATCNGKKIVAIKNGKIFMPLYQDQGSDGFFIIRSIPKFFLKLSAVLRKTRIDKILALLPGVQWNTAKKDSLIVNLKWARFFSKDFFHLLGYRSKIVDRNHLIFKNREVASKREDYKETHWFQKN